LLKQNFISQNAYDNSESSLEVSQGTVKSAEAQVQIARNALRDAQALSPLDGVVAKRHVQIGEKVAFDSPLVTVVDLTDMELQAAVPAVDVPELSIGKAVELTIDGFGERRFTGRVERINPSAEAGTRAILVYVGIPNRDGASVEACSPRAASRSPQALQCRRCRQRHSHGSGADLRVDRRRRQARQARRHDRPQG
jgi:RND family efflux transporter MFP subunit